MELDRLASLDSQVRPVNLEPVEPRVSVDSKAYKVLAGSPDLADLLAYLEDLARQAAAARKACPEATAHPDKAEPRAHRPFLAEAVRLVSQEPSAVRAKADSLASPASLDRQEIQEPAASLE